MTPRVLSDAEVEEMRQAFAATEICWLGPMDSENVLHSLQAARAALREAIEEHRVLICDDPPPCVALARWRRALGDAPEGTCDG